MEALTPDLVAGLTLTAGLGLLMVSLARGRNMLEERGAEKRCPSCGHLLDRKGSCGCLQ
jgi:exosome complex RNA-binding protein Csl4